MRLHEVQEGQSFVLLRTGQQYTHYGRHPKKWWVLTAPYSPIPHECKKLHISCDVKIVEQSNKNTGKHKYQPEIDLNHNFISPDHRYACKDRPRPGGPWLPLNESNSCGHTWRETDPSCTGCKWREA